MEVISKQELARYDLETQKDLLKYAFANAWFYYKELCASVPRSLYEDAEPAIARRLRKILKMVRILLAKVERQLGRLQAASA